MSGLFVAAGRIEHAYGNKMFALHHIAVRATAGNLITVELRGKRSGLRGPVVMRMQAQDLIRLGEMLLLAGRDLEQLAVA
jgi:hypothetical protein